MDDKIFDQIQHVDLKKTMETSYIDYAMSVIASRALPDVRDGLKPVQRRILFSMNEMGNTYDKPHKKCARIVGDTMGKYHPHGDSSIYGALVNMAQPWSMRYTLVDGHGNFGSVDGDGAAAMRYTEARLSKISSHMIEDLGKDTVDFVPNYDETEKEPAVLPARFPNLLVNGTTGIAVGMATNIPPHNLSEVINAVVKIIDNEVEGKETTIDELMEIVKGPDFPTGGIILGTSGINEAYRTGRGKVRVRAVTNIEPMDNGKNRIVVTELPYLVNKAKLKQVRSSLLFLCDCWNFFDDNQRLFVIAKFLLDEHFAFLSALSQQKCLGENSCFPPNPFSAFDAYYAASPRVAALRAECLRRQKTFF